MNYCCGVSQHVRMLSKNLTGKKHRVVIAAKGGTMEKEFQDTGISFENIPFSLDNLSISEILKTYCKIIQVIKKYDIDIVHSHHRWLELIVHLTRPFHSSFGIMTCHNLLLGKREISYKSKKIIAVSDAVQCHLNQYFGVDNEKITMIRNAPREFEKIDKERIIQYKKDIGNLGKSLVIGGFGRLHKEKGFDILLEALIIASSNGYHIDCVIAGDGPERENLEKIATENKLRIRFLGEVQNLSLCYELCDIIVIPSRKDAAPLIALEAASFTKPIIASSVGGLKEIVTNRINGLTFEFEQSQQLYEAIVEYLLNEELRNQCAENLNALLIESYSIDKMVAKTEFVYKEVLCLC